MYIYILSPKYPRRIKEGTATAKASTKPELLKRALKDITDKYNPERERFSINTHQNTINKHSCTIAIIHT